MPKNFLRKIRKMIGGKHKHSTSSKSRKYDQSPKMIDEELQEMKEVFAMFDKNNDGIITTKELISVLRSLGENPTENEMEYMIRAVDTDGNGALDFCEFLHLMMSRQSGINEMTKEAFEIFDTDGSGAISSEEFRKVMMTQGAQMTNEEVNEIINEVDVDGDGKINLEELMFLLKHG